MAFDGIVIANLAKELNDMLTGGRIYKIAQPEKDELLLTIKNQKNQYRLLLSADAGLPLVYMTESNKQSPMTAPNFCMLLRKHISNGRILEVTQPGLERILRFEIEHLDELGDLCRKTLVVEIMGKHSNIIFCRDDGMIIDSIKHVPAQMSSVREVLPGREYFIPQTQDKQDPLFIDWDQFLNVVFSKPMKLSKALYTSLTGISPLIAEELCFRASLESDQPANTMGDRERLHLFRMFELLMEDVRDARFVPNIVSDGRIPVEFSSIELTQYRDLTRRNYDTISMALEAYYAAKNTVTRIRQRSSDLRRVVQTILDRDRKKYELQQKQMKDTEKKDKYKVYGELINTYGYHVEPGSKSMEALNYYTNEMITIPLDPMLTPLENGQKYFDKYNKLKRTAEALESLLKQTHDQILHLESIGASLDIALSEEDLVQIKEEMVESGYIRRKNTGKKVKITSKPFHYISSDGYHMYVGKNNYQNEELTFKFASGNDWWFHAKGIPGSHVIVKSEGAELPDRVFEEAGRLAAYYSKGREAGKVEIDYTEKKNVKKPNGSKPGFVVYYTNYSLTIEPDLSGLTLAD